ncbi:acetolactate synthase small subunit [Longibaculum muris]|uniref:acetolactate synthase small subunit n=1 Tax=Longibaculum muris TaxID=1796628 RepID=UPI003AB35F59
MEELVLSILVHNSSGVLTRVSGLFARRGYNIDSLTVGTTNTEGVSRMTVVAHGDQQILEQIEKQLRKLEDVIEIFALPRSSSVYRELVMVKVEADQTTRADIVSIVDIFRAKIVDVSPHSMVIEVTGNHGKVDGLLAMLDGFNIVEIVRTGLSGIARGLSDFDIKKEDN